jgi:hypothetical protein
MHLKATEYEKQLSMKPVPSERMRRKEGFGEEARMVINHQLDNLGFEPHVTEFSRGVDRPQQRG